LQRSENAEITSGVKENNRPIKESNNRKEVENPEFPGQLFPATEKVF